jgi:replicative DNA helicase
MSDSLINIDAESVLLGDLLFNNAEIDRVADLVVAEDFCEPAHGLIYSAIVREASLGRAVTAVTLKPYFEGLDTLDPLGGMAYLARLSGEATCYGTTDIAKQIADLAHRRQMRAGLSAAAEACADIETPIGESVGHADAAISSTGKDTIHQPTGGDCIDELLRGFGEPSLGITCGTIPSLDRLLGQIRPKQLLIAAGRPGMGKTALALSYAIGAAQKGHGVLFVSLEMSSRELAARMVADMCFAGGGVPYSSVRDGKLNEWQHRQVVQAGSLMRGLPFSVVDAGNLTIGRLNMLIRRHARRMAARGQELQLVVVDYLQLLSPDTRGRSNYEAVSEVSRGLKAMAKDHGIAVFALAQLSREVEKRADKRPQLADLRDSGQIEQDADAVLFLLRNEYYLQQAEPDAMSPDYRGWQTAMEGARGQIEFILAKRRNGVTGSATGQFHGAFQAVR